MLIICQIDWREVGVAFELQCLHNCTLSSFVIYPLSCTDELIMDVWMIRAWW